jgi:uncharacterized FAD-dependent dehydrogenase
MVKASMIYDIIIIGAGPAGVMAAYKLMGHNLKILLIDKGKDIHRRKDLICGWFGSGLSEMDNLILQKKTRHSLSLIKKISKQKITKEQETQSFSIEQGKSILEYFHNILAHNVEIVFGNEVVDINKENGGFRVILENKEVFGKKCVIACGKYSFDFINKISKKFNLDTNYTKCKLGVRIEVPARFNGSVCFPQKINEKLFCEDLRKNSFVGEWEESKVLSSFATIPTENSKKTNLFIGTEETIDVCLRNIQIVNVLNNDKIKKEYAKEFFSSRSITNHIPIFSTIKDFLKTLSPKLLEYMAIYIPELRIQGFLNVDNNLETSIDGLYGIGKCVTGIDSMLLAMESGWKVGEKLQKEKG